MRALPFVYAGTALLASAVGLALWTGQTQADSDDEPKVPRFKVDSTWPKPFPTTPDPVTGRPRTWIPGEIAGTCTDSNDHIFIVTRGNLIAPEDVKGIPAPPVIEFDTKGEVVLHGATGTCCRTASTAVSSITRTMSGSPATATGLYRSTPTTACCCCRSVRAAYATTRRPVTCGNSGANPVANQSKTLLNQPADMYVDPKRDPVTGERGSIYIADGYGNHRVVVFSANGTYLRQWGGVAGTVNNPVTDFPAFFGAGDGGHPHCVVIGNDEHVYVCDRQNDRIQVFTKTGTLTRVIPVMPGTGQTIARAADRDSARRVRLGPRLSNDRKQAYMFEADGGNEQMLIMDRQKGTILSNRTARTPSRTVHLPAQRQQGFERQPLHRRDLNGRRIQKFEVCNEGRGRSKDRDDCD